MGFNLSKRVVVRTKAGRGESADAAIDAMKNSWNELNAMFNGMNDDEKK